MDLVADVVVENLKEFGVETVFGLPGGENVELLDAIRRAGMGFVLVHNESSAVFMADVTARLTGKPGACLVTLGPGATNALAGVAHAFLDRAPVVVMTAQVPDQLRAHHTHQCVDLVALYSPVVKSSWQITPDNARRAVRLAIEQTAQGRPGPVHLQMSNEDAGKVAVVWPPQARSSEAQAGTLTGLAAARELLARARRPAIVVGVGVEPERPYEALRELAQSARAPVVCTPKAKGSLPDDHPLAAGTIGLTRNDPAYEILDQADCLIAVGFDVAELVKPWNQSAPLVWIAPWENRDPVLDTCAEYVGPMGPVLRELAGEAWASEPTWGETCAAGQRDRSRRRPASVPEKGHMWPQDVLTALRGIIPRDAILTTDVGSHKILACLTWPSYVPNSFFVSNGLSCMGFGLPAAIAASLACPDRTVVCVTGDAGMAMKMGELAVLARLPNPVIVVVMKDNLLSLIRSHQLRAGKPAFGTDFVSPDFVAIARAYGLQACQVTTGEQCAGAVASAVRRREPTVVEAVVDPAGYAAM